MDVAAEAPETLSEWKIFDARGENQVLYDVFRYELNYAAFSDYAHKSRTLYLPKGKKAKLDMHSGILEYPEGSIFVKEFFYYARPGQPCYPKGAILQAAFIDQRLEESDYELEKCRLETRLLENRGGEWTPYIYLWKPDQSAAVYTPKGGFQKVELSKADRRTSEFTYSYPDLGECGQCHTGALGRGTRFDVIGPSLLDRIDWGKSDTDFLSITDRQKLQSRIQLPKNLDDQARGYLDINCAHCHNANGLAASSALYLGQEINSPQWLGVCKSIVASGADYGGRVFDIVPGRPQESILLIRMKAVAVKEKMPEIGRSLVDELGVDWISHWILSMSGDCALAD